MKSLFALPALAALVFSVSPLSSIDSVAAEPPLRPLQPPVDSGQLRDLPDPSNAQARRRVTAPPKPEVQTQVVPGVTFLHKEGSSTAIRLARQRVPGSEPTLDDGSPTILPEPGSPGNSQADPPRNNPRQNP
jgi:hypothetical protein